MPELKIASYKVQVDLARIGDEDTTTTRRYVLELKSEPLYHGAVFTIEISCSTDYNQWPGPGVVGSIEGFETAAPMLRGWFPLSEYTVWYDLLRNEKPLWLHYEVHTERPLNLSRLALGSKKEPLGEGPKDLIQTVMAAS